MGIGWNEIKRDLGQVKTEDELRTLHNAAYGERATDQDLRQLSDFVLKMQVGDRVFVKRGIGELVGYGEVASGYFYDETRPEYRHLRKANWLKIGSWSIPEGEKGLPIKTLTEIRDPARRDALLALIGRAHGDVLFDKKAFELLAGLREHPLQSFYEEHADEFDAAIEAPLRRLMSNVASALPASITAALETQKRIFSRIPKNDYGKGGAWDFYWGAFYPKGGKRTADAQFYVFISSMGLRYGFYIGDYGIDPKRQFAENCREYGTELKALLEPALAGADFRFGDTSRSLGSSLPSTDGGKLTWSEWLSNPEAYGVGVTVESSPDLVVKVSEADITAQVVKTFERLFPLMALAQSEAPLETIRRYMGTEPPTTEEQNPVFGLDQVASAAYMTLDGLQQWVRAIERKSRRSSTVRRAQGRRTWPSFLPGTSWAEATDSSTCSNSTPRTLTRTSCKGYGRKR